MALIDDILVDAEPVSKNGLRTYLMRREFSSLLDAGAVGDGVTDDTVNIQAVIDGGGVIDGMGRTYKVTDTINITQAATRLKNFQFVGEKTDGRMIEVTGDRVVIEDFTIDGGFPEDAVSQGDAMIDGIFVNGASHVKIRRGTVQNFYGKVGANTTAGIGLFNSPNARVSDIDFANVGYDNRNSYVFSARAPLDAPVDAGTFRRLSVRRGNTAFHFFSVHRVRAYGLESEDITDNGIYLIGDIFDISIDNAELDDTGEAVVYRAYYQTGTDGEGNPIVDVKLDTAVRLTNFTVTGARTRALALREGGGLTCDTWTLLNCVSGFTTSTSFTNGVRSSQFRNITMVGTTGAPIALGGTVNCNDLDFDGIVINGVNVTNAIGIGTNPNNIRFNNVKVFAGGGTGTVAIAFPGTASAGRRGVVNGLTTDLATPVSYNAEDAIAVARVSPTGGFVFDGASGSNGWRRPFWAGTHALWVDSTGVLRIKSSAPASDTDGTVVGSQS